MNICLLMYNVLLIMNICLIDVYCSINNEYLSTDV